MSFKHGKLTELWLDGSDLSSYCDKFDSEISIDIAAAPVFKQGWKGQVSSQTAEGKATAGGLYDPTYLNLRSALNVDAGSVLTGGPAGLATLGDFARLFLVKSTTYKESSPVGGLVAFEWGADADGQVGMGVVLQPLTTVDTDGSGSYHTAPGATTGGAIAHLHVMSVSASDSVVVTVEHSTDHSSWATLGTFASKSAAGAERLVIAGTVNRYTRVSWDVTGSAVSIQFGVALARL